MKDPPPPRQWFRKAIRKDPSFISTGTAPLWVIMELSKRRILVGRLVVSLIYEAAFTRPSPLPLAHTTVLASTDDYPISRRKGKTP
jgi:hypothetical protein